MELIKIDRTNCMEIILQEVPTFISQWEQHLEGWMLPFERPLALDVAEFADFAVEKIQGGEDAEIDRIVTIIERMLLEGDPIVSYAFRTMFLEQIAHRAQRCEFSLDLFVDKLEPVSYYYWQALDRSLGIYPPRE
jgi:hypothetical protein